MRIKAKPVISVLAAISLLFCGGCDNSNNVLSQIEKSDISYIMKTDLTCVNGEELYVKTPFYVPSDILIRYENPVYFDGRRLYFFRYSITDAETDAEKAESGMAVAPRTAVIAYYNIERNEVSLLLEEENKTHIRYSFAACNDSDLYYYRIESENGGTSPLNNPALYKINIETKESQLIYDGHTMQSLSKGGGIAAENGSIFFEYSQYSDSEEGIEYTTYCLDGKSGEYKEFKKGIYGLMKYKDGIAYFKDNTIYYFNLIDNTETEIYSPSEDGIISFFSNGEKIFYQLYTYNEETESSLTEIGYISKGKKTKIGDNLKNNFFRSMTGEDMFLMALSGGENLIYDEQYDCIVRISLNREYHYGFAAENSVIFVCYDNGGQNPIFYLYSREKVKSQQPSVNSQNNNNMLEYP